MAEFEWIQGLHRLHRTGISGKLGNLKKKFPVWKNQTICFFHRYQGFFFSLVRHWSTHAENAIVLYFPRIMYEMNSCTHINGLSEVNNCETVQIVIKASQNTPCIPELPRCILGIFSYNGNNCKESGHNILTHCSICFQHQTKDIYFFCIFWTPRFSQILSPFWVNELSLWGQENPDFTLFDINENILNIFFLLLCIYNDSHSCLILLEHHHHSWPDIISWELP